MHLVLLRKQRFDLENCLQAPAGANAELCKGCAFNTSFLLLNGSAFEFSCEGQDLAEAVAAERVRAAGEAKLVTTPYVSVSDSAVKIPALLQLSAGLTQSLRPQTVSSL